MGLTFGKDRPARLPRASFVVADVETTGVDKDNDRVVEFALVRFDDGEPTLKFSALVDPFIDIPATASAVHLLRNCDVDGRPSLNDYAEAIAEFVSDLPVVAHNADFDRAFLPMLGASKWICSLRLARRLWSDAPGYSNSVLRFWLNIEEQADLSHIVPHRAEGDAIVTGHIFHRQLNDLSDTGRARTMSDVISLCWSPIPVTHFHYGRKYRGQPLAQIPEDYLLWVEKQMHLPSHERKLNVDPDTLAAVSREITQRWWPPLEA